MATPNAGENESNHPSTPKAKRFSSWLLWILTMLAAFGGMLTAQHWGMSPTVFFLIGGIVAPLLIWFIGKYARTRPRITQFICVVFVFIGCVILAYMTSHPSPVAVYQSIFDAPPPQGLRNASARVQWFDGQTCVLQFDCEQEVFDAIVKQRQAKPADLSASTEELAHDIWRSWWKMHIGNFGRMADPSLRDCPSISNPQAFEWRWENKPDRFDPQWKQVNMLRDPQSKHVWVVYDWT